MTKYWFLGELYSCKLIWFTKALSKPAACIYRQSRVRFVTDHVKPSLWMLISEGRLFINAATNVKWVEFCMQSCVFLHRIDAIGMPLIACIIISINSAWKEGELYATQFYLSSRTNSEWQQKLPRQVLRKWEQYLTLMNEITCIMKAVLMVVDSWESTLGGFLAISTSLWLFIIILRRSFHFVAIRMCGRGS